MNYIGIKIPSDNNKDDAGIKDFNQYLVDRKMWKGLKMNNEYWTDPKNYRYLTRAKTPLLNWILWNAAVMSLDSHAGSTFGSSKGLIDSLKNSIELQLDEIANVKLDEHQLCSRLAKLGILFKFADLMMDLVERHERGHLKRLEKFNFTTASVVKWKELIDDLQPILFQVSCLIGFSWYIEKHALKVTQVLNVDCILANRFTGSKSKPLEVVYINYAFYKAV
jgi:hypothetical protein